MYNAAYRPREFIMPRKNIRLDLEAYNLLKRAKKESESFSQVIRRLVPPFDLDKRLKSGRENRSTPNRPRR